MTDNRGNEWAGTGLLQPMMTDTRQLHTMPAARGLINLPWLHLQANDAEAPVVVIDGPEQCPFADRWGRRCEKCAAMNGVWAGWKLPKGSDASTPRRVRYDMRTCLDRQRTEATSQRAVDLLAACGLSDEQRERTFAATQIDQWNERLIAAAMVWNPRGGRWLYIDGCPAQPHESNPTGNGTGKSHLLHALTIALCQRGIAAYFSLASQLEDELKAAWRAARGCNNADEREDEVIHRYRTLPVWLADDLGRESMSDAVSRALFRVVDWRIENGMPMVISSNLTIGALRRRLHPDHAGAIASRLRGACDVWHLGGPDRRIARPPSARHATKAT